MGGLEVLVKEWEDIRDQIKRRVEQRNYMTEIMVALVSGLITAAFTSDNFLIIGIVPFISAFFLLLIRASYVRHRYLTDHIKELEKHINLTLNDYCYNAVPYWEQSFIEKTETNRHMIYNAFNLGVFCLCGAVFTLYVLPLYIDTFSIHVILGTVYLYGAYAVLVISWINNYDIQSPPK